MKKVAESVAVTKSNVAYIKSLQVSHTDPVACKKSRKRTSRTNAGFKRKSPRNRGTPSLVFQRSTELSQRKLRKSK